MSRKDFCAVMESLGYTDCMLDRVYDLFDNNRVLDLSFVTEDVLPTRTWHLTGAGWGWYGCIQYQEF